MSATTLSLYLACGAAAWPLVVGGQLSSIPRQDFWVTDDYVYALAAADGVVYVGGIFGSTAPNAGRGHQLNIFSGESAPLFPQANGAILSAVSDGAGGWFIGGEFTSMGGLARTNLAHVLADLTVDTNWAPNPHGFAQLTQRSRIFVLARSERVLYVGGIFTNIAGTARSSLAALDPVSGGALPWNGNVFGEVYALELAGERLFLGGTFSLVGGASRNGLAAVDALSGDIQSWAPSPSGSFVAITTLDAQDDTLYVGGLFQFVNGMARTNLAAVDVNSGELRSWNPGASSQVESLAVSCNTVYLSGSFTNIAGLPRNRLAALDAQTGEATPWNPDANSIVYDLLVVGNTVYAGGHFTSMGGLPRNSLAEIDLNTGQVRPWNPGSDRVVLALALAGNNLFAGGGLSAGGLSRQYLAAFDSASGQPLAWDPNPDGPVYALAVSNDVVYVGGRFTQLGGQSRTNLGAVSRATGLATSWRADVGGITNAAVYALLLRPDALYVGGFFTSLASESRYGAGAVRLSDSTLLSWAPRFSHALRDLAASDSVIYAGGHFTTLDGLPRRYVVGFDEATGALTSWEPTLNGAVRALAIEGDTLYVGGDFTQVNGATRLHAAAVLRADAALTPWNPGVTGGLFDDVRAFAVSGDFIYIGGSFNRVGNQSRQGLAVVDRALGLPTTFDAHLGDWRAWVEALVVADSALYCGGAVVTFGDEVRPCLASFVEAGFPRIIRQPAPQNILPGQMARFDVEAEGQPPLHYQWQVNGTDLAGATNTTLTLADILLTQAGAYRVVVSNGIGRSTSIDAQLTPLIPVTILTQPLSQTASPGDTITFSVVASGNPPPSFQWKLNGVVIPGAIQSTLTLSNAQPTNSGIYTVVVSTGRNTIESQPAELLITAAALAFADNFADRGSLAGSSGIGSGTNIGATREADEDRHGGKPGGSSIWLSWVAPESGIVLFDTRGSSFDTLFAVYTNAPLGGTGLLASDDDRGGFLASLVAFNTVAGREYHLAVDGFFGATGRVVLSWRLETTPDELPHILVGPQSQTVSAGATVTLDVIADSQSFLSYQWLRDCMPIPSATNRTLVIAQIQPAQVGLYSVRVGNQVRTNESLPAVLEIGPDATVLSYDKLEDLLLRIGVISAERPAFLHSLSLASASPGIIPVTAGVLGSQILNNTTATTQQAETNHCSVIGGSSRWLSLQAETNGLVILDTLGSTIDTVLAVYTGTDLLSLNLVACDNNGAPDGIRSQLSFHAVAGTDYLVAVDGVNSAQGTINLNWRLGSAPVVISPSVQRRLRVGESYLLSVIVTNGLPAPAFQWLLNGRTISGATNSMLHLTNVQPAQAGAYSLVVSNLVDQRTNMIAQVSVASPIMLGYALVPATGQSNYFRVIGPPNSGAVVEATTNLREWLPLYTNMVPGTPLDFLDVNAPANLQRTYRVVPWP